MSAAANIICLQPPTEYVHGRRHNMSAAAGIMSVAAVVICLPPPTYYVGSRRQNMSAATHNVCRRPLTYHVGDLWHNMSAAQHNAGSHQCLVFATAHSIGRLPSTSYVGGFRHMMPAAPYVLCRRPQTEYVGDRRRNMPSDAKFMRAAHDLDIYLFGKRGAWADKLPEATLKAEGGNVLHGLGRHNQRKFDHSRLLGSIRGGSI